MQKKIILYLCITLLPLLIIADSNVILEIDIKGTQNIDENLIKSVIAFEIGDALSRERISQTIKDLYQLGVFNDINIIESEMDNGIRLTVEVKEYPVVNSLTISGNDKIKTAKIRELSNLKKGSYWTPFNKNKDIKKIKEKYKEKGYHTAAIEYEVENLPGNKVDLNLKIDEGKKVKIEEIAIHGNKEISADKIRGVIKTKENSLFRSGKFEPEQFEKDLVRIIQYYNEKGYVDSRIISHEKNIKNGEFYIDIYLFEGNSYRFGDLSCTGNERFTDEIIKAQFTFNKNETFNLEKFKEELNKVASLYYEEGYIYSRVDYELFKEGNRIDIEVQISENTRAKIRKIHITGNRKTKEKVIIRHLAISPGEYFRQSRIVKSQQNIYNSGFFEPNIKLDYRPINQNGDIDLYINVSDKTSGSANGGVALNSQEGLVGQLSVSHNNLFGNAWQSGIKWEFGGKTQNFDINFTNPYFLDTSTLVGLDIYHNSREWSTYKIYTNGGGIKIGRPVWFLNQARIVLGYSFYSKKYKILDSVNENQVSQELRRLDDIGWQNTSSVSFRIYRDSRDNVFFPTTGSNISLYNEIAGGPLQGDFDYFKQIAQLSWFTKTFWKFVIRTKWRFGYVTGYNNKEVPPDEKFYLGGTGVDGLRGYDDRSIGPLEGGKREMIFSSEYACPIATDQIVGLIFFDAGNSFNHLEEFNFWKFKKGAGIGIRIQSPFGLIGFDYAYGFNNKNWQPHFQFGTTF